MQENKEIKNIIQQRHITRLCHMTQINKVIAILCSVNGILATDLIVKKLLFTNDKDRLDGRKDYISSSVQYPNVWYYRNKKETNPSVRDWAIFIVDPAVCSKEDTLFCPINAATSHGAYINSGEKAFSSMFAESVGRRNRYSRMLACCPTNDQAEVLVHNSIPHDMIKGIVFEDEIVLQKVLKILDEHDIPYPDLYVSSELFSTTCSNLIRQGIKPDERLVVKGDKKWQNDLCS